jgi:hypothetical protein
MRNNDIPLSSMISQEIVSDVYMFGSIMLTRVISSLEWPAALGGNWGSICSPHIEIAIGGIFHRTSPVRPPGKFGGPL